MIKTKETNKSEQSKSKTNRKILIKHQTKAILRYQQQHNSKEIKAKYGKLEVHLFVIHVVEFLPEILSDRRPK